MSTQPSILAPVEGFAPGVGLCLAALEEVRAQLRETVAGLSDKQIAKRAVPGAHSIGALVLHIGEAEWWWMNCVIGGQPITEKDRRAVCWDALIKEDRGEEFAARGLSAEDCLRAVDDIRAVTTRRTLAAFGDEDLDRLYSYKGRAAPRPVSLRWVLHHLVDHEAQHKGQILMLKRLVNGD